MVNHRVSIGDDNWFIIHFEIGNLAFPPLDSHSASVDEIFARP